MNSIVKIKNLIRTSKGEGFIPHINVYVAGFTMIELLVSISVFTIIISITSGIFTTSLRSHRASVALIAANSDAQLTLEQMARVIRRGEGKTFESVEATDGVTGKIYKCLNFKSGNDFISYRWNMSKKNIEWNSNLNASANCANGNFSGIISENLRVDMANFRIACAGGTGDVSCSSPSAVKSKYYPKITILLRVGSNATQIASAPFTNLEVTISPRSDKRD